MRDALLTGVKGFAMGAANVVPGVSGGTIAVITGIYERLIDALKNFNVETAKLFIEKKFSKAAARVDLGFLIALGLGVVLSFITLARVLKWALVKHESLVMAFFFGLILASIYFVGKLVKSWTPAVIALFVVGLCIAASMAFLPPAAENSSFLYLMLCGAVGMCSMIIPGLSGSFVLLLMGNYGLILESINRVTSGDLSAIYEVVLPVGIGAVLGVALLARFLSWLFKVHHDKAMGLVTGFIAGSLAVIWPWKDVAETITVGEKVKVVGYDYFIPDFTSSGSLLAIGLMAVGVILMALTEKLAPASE